jgi:TcpE family
VDGPRELPCFTAIFRSEKVITRIHDLRLPVPLTASQVGMFLALFALCLLAYTGTPLHHANPLLVLFVVPAGGAWALSRMRIDGRSTFAAGLALASFVLRPRRTRRGKRFSRPVSMRVPIAPT